MKKLLCSAAILMAFLAACTANVTPTEEWCNILDEIMGQSSGTFTNVIEIKSNAYFITGGFDLENKKVSISIEEGEDSLLDIIVDNASLYISTKKPGELEDTNNIETDNIDYILINFKDVLSQNEINTIWNQEPNNLMDGLYNEFKISVKELDSIEYKENSYILTLDDKDMLSILERLFVYIQNNINEFTPIINKAFCIELANENVAVVLNDILENLKNAPELVLEVSLSKTATYTGIIKLTIDNETAFYSLCNFVLDKPNIEVPENYVNVTPKTTEKVDVNSPDYSFSLDTPNDLDSFFSGGFRFEI